MGCPSYGKNWSGQRHPNPEISTKSVSRKFIQPYECEKFLRIMEKTNNDFKSRELHFDKFFTPQTSSCWKIWFKTTVCCCSNFPAMLWIKEVAWYWVAWREDCISLEQDFPEFVIQYGRRSRSSWAKSVRSSFGRTVVGKAIRESSIGAQLVESS